ncbi:MAG: MBL fold metallo-hydrolase [Desulfobacterales bacterium]
MKSIPHSGIPNPSRYPHEVVKEQLPGGIELSNFFFRYGANIYVFTYEKFGRTLHTFIDAGYADHQRSIFRILESNGIRLSNIENIIITHRHPDHCGLAAALAEKSGSAILAHANFKRFVDGDISPMERKWMGKFDPTPLAKCNMVYLEPGNGNGVAEIGGLAFPRMGPGIDIGGACRLEIITCPESTPTHSPDQLLILYSPQRFPYCSTGVNAAFKPTDDIIFSGDLWLMQGPIFEKSLRSLRFKIKFFFLQWSAFIFGRGTVRRLPREQDAAAKDAVKRGFGLIRVKPGHGREFLGSSLIPNTLLADRDLLVHLGFAMDADKSILESKHLLPRIDSLLENAYTYFVATLRQWIATGYCLSEIRDLLVRIYKEQSGGGKLVEQDRAERRVRLARMLQRLASESIETDDLNWIAEAALARVSRT